jgi:hypothetical protein
MVRYRGKNWVLLCLREAGLLAPKEWQITTQWRSWVPILLWGRGGSPTEQEHLVISTGPLCSVGREASWHQQNIQVWILGFTYVCGSGLLALSNKLRVPVGQ